MKTLLTFILLIAATLATEILQPAHVVVPVFNNVDSIPEGRITNGERAATGQFPYQVGLQISINAFSSSWCGGSLIAKDWVLTAAHCIPDSFRKITVILGTTMHKYPGQSFTVTKNNTIVHAGFSLKIVQNDIALIKLPKPVRITSTVQPIELPTSSSGDYLGDTAVVSGWGLDSDSARGITSNLNYGMFEIDSASVCTRVFGKKVFTSKNVCANTKNLVSTCQGDSGGPLVSLTDGKQIGIVSYGSSAGCAKGYPVAFTRVSSFIDWINEHTGLNFI